MSYLSIAEKFKILFDMILDFKFIFIFLGVLVIATFLYYDYYFIFVINTWY